jgi:hypothetical protein
MAIVHQAPILVAIPDDWRTAVYRVVEQHTSLMLTATTHRDMVDFVHGQSLAGLITTAAWLLHPIHPTNGTFFESVRGRVPTITLIERTTQPPNFISVFAPPRHNWCTLPFAEEELVALMQQTGMILLQ